MLPEYNSLKDNELRYRKKHLDLITNPESLEVLKIRSKIFSELRK
jgi:lysyl-tRNA synthetase class 2